MHRGTVLMVSHDRHFLDRTVTRIVELQADRAETYSGIPCSGRSDRK